MLKITRNVRSFATKTSKVGFIGLGMMGFPMAKNLVTKMDPKSEFWVYDVTESASARFAKEHPNARIAKSPMDLAKSCNVIISMVPAPKHVMEVYLGEHGVVKGLIPGSLLIDSSTIGPGAAKEVSKAISAYPCNWIDAPVSGGTPGAHAGTLTFMVGSKEEAIFNDAKQYLQHMGKNIAYCGPIGHGQIAKICNNMMLGISMIAASETLNLGVRLGMDAKLLSSILNTSTGRCWSTDSYNPVPGVMENVPSSRDYTGGFAAHLTHKDLGLAIEAAQASKSTVMLASVALQVYNQLITTPGFENKDFSSVFKWLDNNSVKYAPKK